MVSSETDYLRLEATLSDEEGSVIDDFDEDRILNGEVTLEEKVALEQRMLRMLLERAKETNRTILLISDKEEYHRRKKSGELCTDNPDEPIQLLFDPETEQLRDMSPVAYHLLDTDEGLFYARIIMHEQGPLD